VEGQSTLADDAEEAGEDLNTQPLPGTAAIAEAERRSRRSAQPAEPVAPAADGAADIVGEFARAARAHADPHVALIDDPQRREPQPHHGFEHTPDVADLRRDRIAAQKYRFGPATTVTQ
jgi:hypothetical protein